LFFRSFPLLKKLSPASNELDFVVCEFVLHGAQQLASLSDEDVEIFIFGWLFELPLSALASPLTSPQLDERVKVLELIKQIYETETVLSTRGKKLSLLCMRFCPFGEREELTEWACCPYVAFASDSFLQVLPLH